MQSRTQLVGHAQLVSLEEPVRLEGAGSETFTLHDALAHDREGPAVIASRRMRKNVASAAPLFS